MSVESHNSSEQSPSNLHALTPRDLKTMASNTKVIGLLFEIHVVATEKAKLNPFDVEAAHLIEYARERIEAVINEKDFLEDYEEFMHSLHTQKQLSKAALEAIFFDNTHPEDEQAIKRIADLFPNKPKLEGTNT
jgi:hypothetical protein